MNQLHSVYQSLLALLLFCGATALSAQVPLDSTPLFDTEEDIKRETNIPFLLDFARRDSIRYYTEMERAIQRARLTNSPIRGKSGTGGNYELQGFDDAGQLSYYTTNNHISANTISTNRVRPGGSAGLNLTGQGVTIRLWEGSPVRTTHQEFGGRVTQVDGSGTSEDHATHVAGTLIASGVTASAQGMAYQANVRARDWNNDLSEMSTEATGGARMSNHSYGDIAGWRYNSDLERWEWWGDPAINATTDWKFGFYNTKARDMDNIVFNAPFYLPVKSAGNDRNDTHSGEHWVRNTAGVWVSSTASRSPDGGANGYDCIPTYGTAKNILTVGAVNDLTTGYNPNGSPSQVVMSSFSGWGPTDDGRIKPDLVANGVGLFSSIAESNTAYGNLNGTSMAAPSVTGSMALIDQHVSNLFPGSALRASAMKALLLHTADECGTAPGPDYRFGWGLMNTEKAIEVISNTGDRHWRTSRDSLNNGDVRERTFYHDGVGGFKVTIAWTDPAGAVSSSSLNPTARKLVNDLDLRVISQTNGNQYLPWRLDPSNPGADATQADNDRDNVEQVHVANLPAGYYTVRVSHKGATLSGGKQIFSMMVSGRASEPSGNVNCANATIISCGQTVSGTTTGAAQQVATCDTPLNTAPGRWYRFTGQGESVTVSTCNSGTNFDTKIGVFSGSCSNLICVAGNDDDISCEGNASKVQFNAAAGVDYYVYVTGYQNESGNFQLSLTCGCADAPYPPSDPIYQQVIAEDSYCCTDEWDDSCQNAYDMLSATCSGLTQLNTCSGSITDGSGSGNYSNNLDCSWLISPPGATSVTLTFTEFDTESGFDFVSIYNGTDDSAPLLGTFSGATIPGPVTGNSGSLFVQFTTDGSVIRPGWSANYTCSTVQQPVANFVGTPTSGTAPLSVQFTDQSTNTPTSWLWNFGNGQTATQQNPSYTYTAPGTYTVSLTATNAAGSNTFTRTAYISVNPAVQQPVANFVGTPTSGTAPLSVQFTDQSTNTPTSWLWNFGNGQTATQQNPSYTYTAPGTYTVSLTATNAAGSNTFTRTAYITVNPAVQQPVANFGASITCGQAPLTVSFSDNSSNDPDNWLWDFGNGANSTASHPTVIFDDPGIYTIRFTAGNSGGSNTLERIGYITVVAPVSLQVLPDTAVCTGTAVALQASGAETYSWTGQGLSANTGAAVSALPSTPGTYLYQVTGTTNNCNANPVVATITVLPIPLVSITASTQSACTGQSVALNAIGADLFSWAGSGLSATSGSAVTTTVSTPGSYTYQATGTSAGCTSAPQAITIQFSQTPVVTLNASADTICVLQSVTLNATGAATYLWAGTGLSATTGSSVTAMPAVPGNYSYSVTGSSNGCTSTTQPISITVQPRPQISASSNVEVLCLGDTLTLTAGGAGQIFWNGPGLLSFSGPVVQAVPAQVGMATYQAGGGDMDCTAEPVSLSVNVLNNALSASIAVSDCPGPDLMFTATVTNGGDAPNILWFRNGQPVWNGPDYTLFGAQNGMEVYCRVTPVNAPPCTAPSQALSNTVVVNCIASETAELLPGIRQWSVFPNPNEGWFFVSVANTEAVSGRLRVWDMLGRPVWEERVQWSAGHQIHRIELPGAAPGVYWVGLESLGQVMRKGVVVR